MTRNSTAGSSGAQLGERAVGRLQRLVRGAERVAEQVVDDRQHLGPRAVVRAQRDGALAVALPHLVPAAPEHVDVGVRGTGRSTGTRRRRRTASRRGPATASTIAALQLVRVLELVDHHLGEPLLQVGADVVALGQHAPRLELEVVEVEARRGALAAGVLGRERLQQVVEQRPQALEHGVARGPLQLGQRRVVVAAPPRAGRATRGRAARPARRARGGCSSSSASAAARARDSSSRRPGPSVAPGPARHRGQRRSRRAGSRPGAASNRSGCPAVRSRSWVPSISVRSRSSP